MWSILVVLAVAAPVPLEANGAYVDCTAGASVTMCPHFITVANGHCCQDVAPLPTTASWCAPATYYEYCPFMVIQSKWALCCFGSGSGVA